MNDAMLASMCGVWGCFEFAYVMVNILPTTMLGAFKYYIIIFYEIKQYDLEYLDGWTSIGLFFLYGTLHWIENIMMHAKPH